MLKIEGSFNSISIKEICKGLKTNAIIDVSPLRLFKHTTLEMEAYITSNGVAFAPMVIDEQDFYRLYVFDKAEITVIKYPIETHTPSQR